jgi:hypothetical protein
MPQSLKRKYKKSQRRNYKKNTFKKSLKRKSLKRNSLKRNSLKRKSYRRKNMERKTYIRKNMKRKSLRGGMLGRLYEYITGKPASSHVTPAHDTYVDPERTVLPDPELSLEKMRSKPGESDGKHEPGPNTLFGIREFEKDMTATDKNTKPEWRIREDQIKEAMQADQDRKTKEFLERVPVVKKIKKTR